MIDFNQIIYTSRKIGFGDEEIIGCLELRIREAREDIREECAKLCESMNDSYAHELARLIRQIEIP
jgi:hypothetical protein